MLILLLKFSRKIWKHHFQGGIEYQLGSSKGEGQAKIGCLRKGGEVGPNFQPFGGRH